MERTHLIEFIKSRIRENSTREEVIEQSKFMLDALYVDMSRVAKDINFDKINTIYGIQNCSVQSFYKSIQASEPYEAVQNIIEYLELDICDNKELTPEELCIVYNLFGVITII